MFLFRVNKTEAAMVAAWPENLVWRVVVVADRRCYMYMKGKGF